MKAVIHLKNEKKNYKKYKLYKKMEITTLMIIGTIGTLALLFYIFNRIFKSNKKIKFSHRSKIFGENNFEQE